MIYQVLKNDYNESPWFSKWNNLVIKNTYSDIDTSMPAILGSDILKPEVRNSIKNRYPAIYIGRGYVGNHQYKTRQLWRYSVNGWANTRLLSIPYSRWNKMNLQRHPWKVTEVKKVLIAPSKMTSPIWDSNYGNYWTDYAATLFPGADIKIRLKERTPGLRWASLWNDLDWADLVVSQGSAITAEAFWYGKKVISFNPCTTWAVEQPILEDWKNPKEPELRDAWHEHLAWSQFLNKEWESGEATELIEKYIGRIHDYNPMHTYSFN
jgi:hypothetical protein